MLLYYLLFFFVALGAKLLLALCMIYLLLPTDPRCSGCDEPTLLIRATRGGQLGRWLTLGRVQWRWCPRCGQEGMARRISPAAHARAAAVNPGARTRH